MILSEKQQAAQAEYYRSICHSKPFQQMRFRKFVNDIFKRRKFKPSRHIVSNRKKQFFKRVKFGKY